MVGQVDGREGEEKCNVHSGRRNVIASWQYTLSPLLLLRTRRGGRSAQGSGQSANSEWGGWRHAWVRASELMHVGLESNEIVGAAGICHLCLICDDAEGYSLTPSSTVIRIFFLPSYLRLFLPPSTANHAHRTDYPFCPPF